MKPESSVINIKDTDFYTKTDSLGKFTLKFDSNLDTVILRIYNNTGYSPIIVKNIFVEDFINIGKIMAIKVPVIINVSYCGISKRKNKHYQRKNQRRNKKQLRKFKFRDVWINNSNGAYWMRKTENNYLYEIDYLELK